MGEERMDKLYIVMPAYNEEKNIEVVIKAWYPLIVSVGNDSRLIVADSGSSDRTHSILLRLQSSFPQLEILTKTGRQHGPKVIALYDYAISQGADFIFQTDSDGQTDPSEFDVFWDLRNTYDAVIGYRPIREDGIFRAFAEKVVCMLLKLYFGVSVPDANAPFRLMKANMVKRHIARLPKDYNLPNIMLTTYFAYYNEKIIFQPVSFKPRRGGSNSVNIPKIVKIGWKALGDFRILKKRMTNTK